MVLFKLRRGMKLFAIDADAVKKSTLFMLLVNWSGVHQMFRIISRETLGTKIHLFKIEAPAIARKALAGQFVVIRIDERGERIPLTLADWDGKEGSVTVVFMAVGATTFRLA